MVTVSGSGMWNIMVVSGMWNVECGMWNVECGILHYTCIITCYYMLLHACDYTTYPACVNIAPCGMIMQALTNQPLAFSPSLPRP